MGDIEQVPPQFSAVKIDGERAYKRARDGEEMEIAARPLFVESLLLIDRPDPDHAVLEMVCGKGGYVRSIARDLGETLGCHGHVARLRRTWSGPFDVEDGVTLEQVETLAGRPDLDALLLPLETALSDLPPVTATAEGAARLRNGNPGMVIGQDIAYGEVCWASYEDRALAIGRYKGGDLHPVRVLQRSS